MESKFTLKIQNETIRRQFLERKNREVRVLSISCFFVVLAIYLSVGTLHIIKKWFEYALELWLPKLFALLIHMILIFFSYKYPLKVCEIHGPCLAILQLSVLIWISGHSVEELNP